MGYHYLGVLASPPSLVSGKLYMSEEVPLVLSHSISAMSARKFAELALWSIRYLLVRNTGRKSYHAVPFNSLQRRTFSRMMSAVAVQRKGLGLSFQVASRW